METNRGHDEHTIYEIRVDGLLDETWSEWLGGLTVTPQADGVTRLSGPVRDEAALHGLLVKIRDLGLPLLSLERKGGRDRDLRDGDWVTDRGCDPELDR